MTAIALTAGGGNFSATGTWSPAQVPVAGDVVTCGSGGGNLTFDGSTNRSCASIDFTGYTHTVTLSGSMNLITTAGVTLGSGMSFSGSTSTLQLNGGQTITSNGVTWPGKLLFQATGTYTLGDDWTVSNLVSCASGSISPTVNSHNLTCNGGLTMGVGCTWTGTTNIKIGGGTYTVSSGSIANNLTFLTSGNATMSGTTLNYTTGTLTGQSSNGLTWSTTVLNFSGNSTLDWPGSTAGAITSMTIASGVTLTLNSRPNFTTFTVNQSGNNTFAGSFGADFGTLTIPAAWTVARTLTLKASQTYTVSSSLTDNGKTTLALGWNIGSDTGGTKAILTMLNGSTHSLLNVNPTDIDSSAGLPVFSYRGTAATTYNWYTTWPVVLRRPQTMLGVG